MGKPRKPSQPSPIPTINLEAGMPLVHEALARLERELALARQQRRPVIKLIHGYGSSGVGGDIRIAVQKRLRELQDQGSIRACIFGEDWSTSDAQAWALLNLQPALKADPHLGKRNAGITIVML
ncbi:MAG: Smr/MutS family protein [Terriglobales bacterium]